MLRTARLVLMPWSDSHRCAFAVMNADPQVMADFGTTLSRVESDAKLDRYAAALRDHGISRWAIEDHADNFLGYVGVMPCLDPDHPLGRHHEIGWRLIRGAWGHGYATEAARSALEDAFSRLGLPQLFAYTAPDNLRSQAVMARLGLLRDPARDFERARDGMAPWRGLVWIARPS